MSGHALWLVWLNVYPNLIASGICTAVVWVKVHVHINRLHRHIAQQHQSPAERGAQSFNEGNEEA